MSEHTTNPTVEEAQQRLADIERQLAEVVPALQAEAMYLRGYITGWNSRPEQTDGTPESDG